MATLRTASQLCVLERLSDMDDYVAVLMQEAEYWRSLYRCGACSRDEAKAHIMPYIDAINKKSKEISIKYNQTTRLVSFASYIR